MSFDYFMAVLWELSAILLRPLHPENLIINSQHNHLYVSYNLSSENVVFNQM